MKRIMFATGVLMILFTFSGSYLAQTPTTGKDLFTNVKGPYGSCNTCHPAGGTAGRWDSAAKKVSKTEGKVIPSLKGIGKKAAPERLVVLTKLMKNTYKIPLTTEQVELVADYIAKF